MIVYAVAGASGDLANHHPEPGIIDLGRTPAVRAHDVMVMRALAPDVRVFA